MIEGAATHGEHAPVPPELAGTHSRAFAGSAQNAAQLARAAAAGSDDDAVPVGAPTRNVEGSTDR